MESEYGACPYTPASGHEVYMQERSDSVFDKNWCICYIVVLL